MVKQKHDRHFKLFACAAKSGNVGKQVNFLLCERLHTVQEKRNLETVELGGHAILRDVENGNAVDNGRLEIEYHPSVVSP